LGFHQSFRTKETQIAARKKKMSHELSYLPPAGTRHKWSSKSLNYSPWVCRLSDQKSKKDQGHSVYFWPMDVVLVVDLKDGIYNWQVEVIDFRFNRSKIQGQEEDPLRACLAAERIGRSKLRELLPPWVKTALANGWRPPAMRT